MDWATNRNDGEQRIPLLTTKLHVARTRASLISRPRLLERLNEGLQRKLTLISAPAGFGKSTLVSEWAQRSKQNISWVSLDPAENLMTQFWAYVVGSLQKIQPGLGSSALDLLYRERVPAMEQVLTMLINELATLPQEFALILDDYHVIDNPEIHSALSFFIERMPTHVHLYIIGRVIPPLKLTRFRAHGEVVEVRAADLRFTPQEAISLLRNVEGAKISADDLADIVSRTEGWAVGLQLASLVIQETKGNGGIGKIAANLQRYGSEYLNSEVLEYQSDQLQSFLLKTSILDKMTGPLCDAVAGTENGGQLLEDLFERNLFVVPLDDEHSWYRYHSMFSELLQQRLRETAPDEIESLHHRASSWCSDHNNPQEAVNHLLRGGNQEQAIRLAEHYAEKLLASGDLSTLISWSSRFPHSLVSSRPQLAMAFAWALILSGEFEKSEKYLESCHRFVDRAPLSGLADLEGHLSAADNFLTSVSQAKARNSSSVSDSVIDWQGVYKAQVNGEHGDSGEIINGETSPSPPLQQRPEAFRPVSTFDVTTALPQLGKLQTTMGQLRTAAETFRHALLQLEREAGGDGRPASSAQVLIGLGEICFEWNDLDGAMRNLTEGLTRAKQEEDPATLKDGYHLLARIHQARGDLDGAMDALNEAERVLWERGAPESFSGSLEADRVLVWIAQGNLKDASRWFHETEPDPHFSLASIQVQLTLTRLFIAQYRSDDALETITPLIHSVEQKGWRDALLRALVLQSLAYDQQGEVDQAVSILIRALGLAEPEGYTRIFVQEGMPMARLLQRARESDSLLSQRVSTVYIDQLLSRIVTVKAADPVVVERLSSDLAYHSVNPMAGLLSPLSDREIEVLQLIGAGKSNAAIADSLFISLSTVKTHINNLYSKLGVESRTQALLRAKEMNVL